MVVPTLVPTLMNCALVLPLPALSRVLSLPPFGFSSTALLILCLASPLHPPSRLWPLCRSAHSSTLPSSLCLLSVLTALLSGAPLPARQPVASAAANRYPQPALLHTHPCPLSARSSRMARAGPPRSLRAAAAGVRSGWRPGKNRIRVFAREIRPNPRRLGAPAATITHGTPYRVGVECELCGKQRRGVENGLQSRDGSESEGLRGGGEGADNGVGRL